MNSISLIALIIFAGWSITVVKEDFEIQKILNKKILIGMKLFALFFLAMAYNTYLGYTGQTDSFLKVNFYGLWFIHFAWTLLAAIILWYGEIWPAGDAKFFILISSCLPLINPFIKTFPHYLFLSLLINIFVVAALFALINYVSEGIRQASPGDFFSAQWEALRQRAIALSEQGGLKKFYIFFYAINIGLIFLLHQIFAMELKNSFGKIILRTEIIYFILFFLWEKVAENFRSKKWVYISITAYGLYFISGYFLFPYRLMDLLMIALMNVLKFSVILFVGRYMFEFIMEKKDTRYIEAHELEPHMVLSSKILRILRDNPVFEGAFDDCFKDGLTAEQIKILSDWLDNLKVEKPKVEIIKGRPFALWIFAGAAIFLIFNNNIVDIAGIFKR
ncbi:MAG: hypothetical protein KAR84_08530 [Elusimicrobiales bacterium]|nr:hypothetical protein [Elusimicrobiales bacterium]MCK5582974.1 hypothetical protein [Elusimicrobiales bacterium]